MAEADLVNQVFNNPLFWGAIILVIVYLIVAKWKEEKKRPEQKPFYGVEVREGMTHKQLGRHIEIWGEKTNYKFYRGMMLVGQVMKVNPIYKYPTPEEIKELKLTDGDQLLETYAISFRKPGFFGWLDAILLNKYEKVLLDPKAFVIEKEEKRLVLDPKAFLINDSGVWSLATNKELRIIDNLNLKVDHENVRGFVSDFPRRLSNLDPGQAIKTEQTSHIYEQEEKAKQSRISSWAGKK